MWCVMDPQVLHTPGDAAPTVTESCRGMFQPLSRSVWERDRRKLLDWHLAQIPLMFHPNSLQVFRDMTISFDMDITKDSGCISYHWSIDNNTPLLLQQRLLANPLAVQSLNSGSVLSKLNSSLTQVSAWLSQKISECHCTSWCSFVPSDWHHVTVTTRVTIPEMCKYKNLNL